MDDIVSILGTVGGFIVMADTVFILTVELFSKESIVLRSIPPLVLRSVSEKSDNGLVKVLTVVNPPAPVMPEMSILLLPVL